MCLIVDRKKTDNFMRYHKSRITVWKVYQLQKINKTVCVRSPVYRGQIYYKLNGSIISDRDKQKYGKDVYDHVACKDVYDYVNGTQMVFRGIHVLLTREAARKYKKDLKAANPLCQYVIVRAEANMVDFVAAGSSTYNLISGYHYNCAVFMAIYVSPKNWKKAKKGDFR